MTRRMMIFGSLLTGLMLLASPAGADETDDLKARFKERYPMLLALQNAGTLGETFDGWVAPVKGELTGDDKTVVDAENVDRKRLYEMIAAKQSAKPTEVAERNAVRKFKSAAPEHWLKLKSGEWKQRKELKLEE